MHWSTNMLSYHGEAKQGAECNQSHFLGLCNKFETTASRNAGKSSPEPGLEYLQFPVYEFWRSRLWWKVVGLQISLLRLDPPKASAQQMSTFHKATRHKKHREECLLRLIRPVSPFYLKAPNLATAALNKEAHNTGNTMLFGINFTKTCTNDIMQLSKWKSLENICTWKPVKPACSFVFIYTWKGKIQPLS